MRKLVIREIPGLDTVNDSEWLVDDFRLAGLHLERRGSGKLFRTVCMERQDISRDIDFLKRVGQGLAHFAEREKRLKQDQSVQITA